SSSRSRVGSLAGGNTAIGTAPPRAFPRDWSRGAQLRRPYPKRSASTRLDADFGTLFKSSRDRWRGGVFLAALIGYKSSLQGRCAGTFSERRNHFFFEQVDGSEIDVGLKMRHRAVLQNGLEVLEYLIWSSGHGLERRVIIKLMTRPFKYRHLILIESPKMFR